jgi:hydroxypyruvate isomerase
VKLKGSIHHSVCRWCYGDIPLDQLCEGVKQIGFGAIDLVGPQDWPVLKAIWHLVFDVQWGGNQL